MLLLAQLGRLNEFTVVFGAAVLVRENVLNEVCAAHTIEFFRLSPRHVVCAVATEALPSRRVVIASLSSHCLLPLLLLLDVICTFHLHLVKFLLDE